MNTGPTCCGGWSGTTCDICSSVDICPDIIIDNDTYVSASSCTSNAMAPINVRVIPYFVHV